MTSREPVAISLIMLLCLCFEANAGATCWNPDLSDVFVTIPADGSVDVPVDSSLWVFYGYPYGDGYLTYGTSDKLEDMGEPIEPSQYYGERSNKDDGGTWARYDMALQPGETYYYYIQETVYTATYGPFSFSTGTAPSATPPSPVEPSTSCTTKTYTEWEQVLGTGACGVIAYHSTCIDHGSGSIEVVELTASSSSHVTHYVVSSETASFLFPAECPLALSFPADLDSTGCTKVRDMCFQIEAYDYSKTPSAMVTYCPGADEPSDDCADCTDATISGECSSCADEESSSGCSMGGAGEPLAAFLLLVLMMGLALLRSRRTI